MATRQQIPSAAANTNTAASARRVVLIRHGEGLHNVRQSQGAIDPRLTPNGQGQAKAIGMRCAKEGFELLIVSPLSRAVETAALAFGDQPKCRVVLSPLHSERWSGSCDEGRNQ